ncbi:hypothetical protein E1180_07875 [Roseibium denhamense]|uniref:Oxidoreductase n=1 Tax=Roseibium denhamense TaxID=76305 RepID=A0ABY1NUH6_9HYPH|nr:hypothetical protein [Roseibium denhamense]MTI05433.1 hypothetical protein [Roseibium denhamense]SMP18676.1 hypothetical protein SAMN06265374_1947 [Roseibium denhamense]
MLITTISQIDAIRKDGGLTTAEEQLLENCRDGEPTFLGDGNLPDAPNDSVEIRADILRYLMLGGCADWPVHERGTELRGAWISGQLDLWFAKTRGRNGFFSCVFEHKIEALQMEADVLNLGGSVFPGLNGQGAKITGGVSLRNANTTGEVAFASAEIGGQLSCAGATLDGGRRDALNAQGAKITGDVILLNSMTTGEVSFSGAEIGGQLSFTGVSLDGKDGYALNVQRLVVKDSFFWCDIKRVAGRANFEAAHAADLVDDAPSWDKVERLRLVGFTYDTLVGPYDLAMRKAWLAKGARLLGDFHPQPYQQLAKFFRDSGHRFEAREILVEKEFRQKRETRHGRLRHAIRLRKQTGSDRAEISARFFNDPHWFGDRISLYLTGYGYKPWRSLIALLVLFGLAAIGAKLVWEQGDFAPNSDILLTSPSWQYYANATGSNGKDLFQNPARCWARGPDQTMADRNGLPSGTNPPPAPDHPGRDYETFSSLYYGIDLVVPIINLGQTDAWAPSTTRGPAGVWFFYLSKVLIALGWIITAIAAAAVTGIIRKDE